MDFVLDNIELRILGCLIEKEMTTPEYYPLSLNALTHACNQKSNRNPVLSLDEPAVLKGLEGLRQKGLARETHATGSRVTKYLHELLSRFDLSRPEMAVLCELMLRGPQTAGELRSNAGRMSPFGNLGEVEETLRVLIEHEPPLAVKLPREAGRKESRHMHLLAGDNTEVRSMQPQPAATTPVMPPGDAVSRLEGEIAEIRKELEELKKAFAEFRSQFS